MNKEQLYKLREENNDKMKQLRKELKLPKHKVDSEKIKSLIKRYKDGELSFNKTIQFIKYVMNDKYYAGRTFQFINQK